MDRPRRARLGEPDGGSSVPEVDSEQPVRGRRAWPEPDVSPPGTEARPRRAWTPPRDREPDLVTAAPRGRRVATEPARALALPEPTSTRPRRAYVDVVATPEPDADPEPDPEPEPGPPVPVPSAAPAPPTPGRRTGTSVGHRIEPIVVDRLVKSYGGRLALRGLSFTVEPGRVTGFLGPSGAGKTTTLRILVGLVGATAGRATFGDTPYAALRHPQQTVGCVLETGFHPARSGRNHLRVLAPTAGASDRRVDEVLGTVGLDAVARQPVGEYSLGMRQRLALASALLGHPDYLVLDEPANGLDPEGIRWLRHVLGEFAATGRTVLVSSHLLNEVEATADDIVVIDRGRLLAQLPITDLDLGQGTVRARVSDEARALEALAALAVQVESGQDADGRYLRVHTSSTTEVGAVLFATGIGVHELTAEHRDLESEFFAMLDRNR